MSGSVSGVKIPSSNASAVNAVEMQRLDKGCKAGGKQAAPVPRASFVSGKWLDIPRLCSRLASLLESAMPRALMQWRATAAFKEALGHIKSASLLKDGPRADSSKAVQAFGRFKALIDSAPAREAMLQQVIRDGFAGKTIFEKAILLSHLKPDGLLYQALAANKPGSHAGGDSMQVFCSEVATKAEAQFDTTRKFKT